MRGDTHWVGTAVPAPAEGAATGRYARQTNDISPPGDFAGEELMPLGYHEPVRPAR